MPDAAANPNFAVFDNYIQDASYLTGIIAGAMTKSGNIGMVGGYPDPRGEPADERLHGGREGDAAPTPRSRSPSSAPGSTRRRPRRRPSPDRCRRGHDVCRTLRRVGCGEGEGRSGDRQRHRHAGGLSRRRWSPRRSGTSSRRWTRPSRDIKGGTFKADNYGVYSFMKDGGCSLAPLGTFEGKVPAEVDGAMVAEKEAAIKAGSFTVRSTTPSRSRPDVDPHDPATAGARRYRSPA